MNQHQWRDEFLKRFYIYNLETKSPAGADKEAIDFIERVLAKAVKEEKKEKDELADALLDMYGQYCSDGHDFMSAGERASTVLELQGYATFDEAGRMQSLLTKEEV